MEYEKRIRKDESKHVDEMKAMNSVFGLGKAQKGRNQFKDLNIKRKKRIK